MHAGPTHGTASLSRRYYVTGCQKIVYSITPGCITCQCSTARPEHQYLGQIPAERITPDLVFNCVGLDYAGPFILKYGSIRNHLLSRRVCLYFCFIDCQGSPFETRLRSHHGEAFITALQRFISHRGKPYLLWSDHGTNSVGAVRELKQLTTFFQNQQTQRITSEFCAVHRITWKNICLALVECGELLSRV